MVPIEKVYTLVNVCKVTPDGDASFMMVVDEPSLPIYSFNREFNQVPAAAEANGVFEERDRFPL